MNGIPWLMWSWLMNGIIWLMWSWLINGIIWLMWSWLMNGIIWLMWSNWTRLTSPKLITNTQCLSRQYWPIIEKNLVSVGMVATGMTCMSIKNLFFQKTAIRYHQLFRSHFASLSTKMFFLFFVFSSFNQFAKTLSF